MRVKMEQNMYHIDNLIEQKSERDIRCQTVVVRGTDVLLVMLHECTVQSLFVATLVIDCRWLA
jgi:hypothetical protein